MTAEQHAADSLAQRLGEKQFVSKIADLVRCDQARVKDSDVVGQWTSVFAKLAPLGVVTTNWDTLLEDNVLCGYRPLRWPEHRAAVAECLRNGEGFVLHLHGDITAPDTLAITSSHCELVRKTLVADRLALHGIHPFHYVIVVGYSFPDEHISELFRIAEAAVDDQSQLVLVLKSGGVRVRDDRRLPLGARVEWYADHKRLGPKLAEIADSLDPSARLLHLPQVRSPEQLLEIVSGQRYSYTTSSLLREMLAEMPPGDKDRVLSIAAQLLADAYADRQVGGLLATMLSLDAATAWTPDRSVLAKLGSIVDSIVAHDNINLVGVAEPLAFAVGRQGLVDAHARYRHSTIDSGSWASADFVRFSNYYGNAGTRIQAIRRHMRVRDGALAANDATRLLMLLWSELGDTQDSLREMLSVAIWQLDRSGDYLHAARLRDRVKRIMR